MHNHTHGLFACHQAGSWQHPGPSRRLRFRGIFHLSSFNSLSSLRNEDNHSTQLRGLLSTQKHCELISRASDKCFKGLALNLGSYSLALSSEQIASSLPVSFPHLYNGIITVLSLGDGIVDYIRH